MNKNRTMLLIAALLFVAALPVSAAEPEPLPRIKPPTVMPAADALFRPEIMRMHLDFMEIDSRGNIRVWGYLMEDGGSAVPAVLFTRDGKWMAAVYDNSPDLAQTGFVYVGRDPSGYFSALDCEVEGAFGELIIARSADGIKWRPAGVMKKESYTQLFRDLQIFAGGRWEILVSPPADPPNAPEYIYESLDSGRSWRLSRKVAPLPDGWDWLHYYLSPQTAGPGNRAVSVIKVSGEIRNPRARE